jgi:hypothetical protein
MDETKAKRQLERLLQFYTSGSVLHLLADLHGQAAEHAQLGGDPVTFHQHKMIEHVLVIVGLGVDASLPS